MAKIKWRLYLIEKNKKEAEKIKRELMNQKKINKNVCIVKRPARIIKTERGYNIYYGLCK